MTNEPRPTRVLGTPGPGKGQILFRAMTKCDCGCGLTNRFEFMIGVDRISISDPEMIRELIDEMRLGFRLLWPEHEQPSA